MLNSDTFLSMSVKFSNFPMHRDIQGLLYGWTEHSADFFLKKFPLGEGSKAPKLHPGGGFFGPWSFIIFKNSHQDLPNEGANFILS